MEDAKGIETEISKEAKKKIVQETIQEIRGWITNLLILLSIPEKETMAKALEEMGGNYPAEHLRAVVIAVINIFMIAAKEPDKLKDFMAKLPKGNLSELAKSPSNKMHAFLDATTEFIAKNAVTPANQKVPAYAREYVGAVLSILFLSRAAGDGTYPEKDEICLEVNALLVLFREAMAFALKEPERVKGVLTGAMDLLKKILYLDPKVFSLLIPPPTPQEVANPNLLG